MTASIPRKVPKLTVSPSETANTAKIMDPIMPILSILRYGPLCCLARFNGLQLEFQGWQVGAHRVYGTKRPMVKEAHGDSGYVISRPAKLPTSDVRGI